MHVSLTEGFARSLHSRHLHAFAAAVRTARTPHSGRQRADRQAAADSGRGLEGEAPATLVLNKLRGGLEVAAMKVPAFGDRRKTMLEDLAILTGGQAISEDLDEADRLSASCENETRICRYM